MDILVFLIANRIKISLLVGYISGNMAANGLQPNRSIAYSEIITGPVS